MNNVDDGKYNFAHNNLLSLHNAHILCKKNVLHGKLYKVRLGTGT
jgi:hypothetical protein